MATLLDRLASHTVTLTSIAGLGIAVLASSSLPISRTAALLPPLGLFVVNVLAAIVTRPSFRRQPALLVFHLALLAIILLAAASRLTYLKGWAEVRSGDAFTGEFDQLQAAPLHFGNLDGVRFRNEGFSIDFAQGGRRRETHNVVSFIDADGVRHERIIGDEHPLELGGYRIYTSANKGFTGTFEWHVAGEPAASLALVSFPSFPAQALRQSYELKLPNARHPVWVQLQLPDDFMPKHQATRFRAPEAHHIVLRYGEQRQRLEPGDEAHLDGHRLRYLRIDTWMGYWIHYDWTRPWLLASTLVAVLSLAWYVLGRITRTPWQR